MSETPDRILLIKAKGGFGNRILSAVTGVVFADLTERKAVIDWRDGDYLPNGTNAYPLLFDSPITYDLDSLDQRLDATPAIWSGRLAEHPADLIRRYYPDKHSSPFVYRKLSINLRNPDQRTPIAVFWSYLPKLDRLRGRIRRSSKYGRMAIADVARYVLDSHFAPNAHIRTAVENLFLAHPGPVIGVHVRHTDRKVSLERILIELDRVLRDHPQAAIFLATDNLHVQEQVLSRYSSAFVIDKVLGDDDNSLHEHTIVDDPLREAQNALIDMWALSRCDWLIHSRHSTFSVAAALIGGIPDSRQRDVDRHNVHVVGKRWIQRWT